MFKALFVLMGILIATTEIALSSDRIYERNPLFQHAVIRYALKGLLTPALWWMTNEIYKSDHRKIATIARIVIGSFFTYATINNAYVSFQNRIRWDASNPLYGSGAIHCTTFEDIYW